MHVKLFYVIHALQGITEDLVTFAHIWTSVLIAYAQMLPIPHAGVSGRAISLAFDLSLPILYHAWCMREAKAPARLYVCLFDKYQMLVCWPICL